MKMSLLPYSSEIGCIMKTVDRKLFPAQYLRTSIKTVCHMEKDERALPDLVAAYILDDVSIIAIEKMTFRSSKLRKYSIQEERTNDEVKHTISKSPTESMPLQSSIGPSSILGRIEILDATFLTVCNTNGTIELFNVGKVPQ